MTFDPIKNGICLELNYIFANNDIHHIDFYIRNTCALAQVEIVGYVIKELSPNETFEILSLPSQQGSYKDFNIVKTANKNSALISILGVILPALLYNSQLEVNKTTSALNTLQIIEKCEEFKLDDYQIQKIKEICNAYFPKKQKNIFYESIMSSKDIVAIRPVILKNEENIFETEIKQTYFKEYIEDLPKEKEYLEINLSGNIQLSQPFIGKQPQYGKGVPWKGVYYGQDIFDEANRLIMADGENIDFYMQDDEYKNQILKQEISFLSGDNIGVVFDISRYYDPINNQFGKPKLYVKKVTSHNDNLVQHKKNLELKREAKRYEDKGQSPLFDMGKK